MAERNTKNEMLKVVVHLETLSCCIHLLCAFLEAKSVMWRWLKIV